MVYIWNRNCKIPNEGYLNYKLTGWEISDIVGDTSNLIQYTSYILNHHIIETSNILNDHIIDTSNILNDKIINVKTDIESELDILENILLPSGSTFLNNVEKYFILVIKIVSVLIIKILCQLL